MTSRKWEDYKQLEGEGEFARGKFKEAEKEIIYKHFQRYVDVI
jgi:hypothetical protein